MNLLYPATITFDSSDNRYFVQFLDLDEAITEGESLKEALLYAEEVLTLTLEGRMDEGIEIPFPSVSTKRKNIYFIAPSARVQTALLMKLGKGKQTLAQLARVLKTSKPAAARLENPHYWPSLKQLERAAIARGQQLVISLEPLHGNK